jgi:TolA-binding protein
MSCEHQLDIAERYVTGDLTEAERVAFEDHFFACAACLARVQDLQMLQDALSQDRREAGAGRFRFTAFRGGWVAAAAAVLLAVVFWSRSPSTATNGRQASPPATSAGPATAAQTHIAPDTLAALAVVTPPRYLALPVRSERSADAQAFDAAMKRYSSGHYEDAARLLRPLVWQSGNLPHAAFFLGVSELMNGHLDAARAALDKAVASGAKPYGDEAHFYIAKLDLRIGDVSAARRELEAAARREAGPPGEAQRLLAALQSRR